MSKDNYYNIPETLKPIIEAYNKSIPAKPDIYGDGYSDGEIVLDSWDCPNCGASYEIDYDDYDYCPICGQAIDWSDYRKDET